MNAPATNLECTDIVPAQLIHALAEKSEDLERFLKRKYAGTCPFIYNSVDIRRSGFKIAPVDTNIFPGGFNNVHLQGQQNAGRLIRRYIQTYHPGVKNITILAENHTRNLYYLENLTALKDILEPEGFAVRFTSPERCEEGEALEAKTISGKTLVLEPYKRENNELIALADNQKADLLLINNDLSSGVPEWIHGLNSPVTPSPDYGWHMRRKSLHFFAYNEVARQCALVLDIDPWLLTALYDRCPGVNFKERSGVECVANRADKLLHRIKAKYKEYGVQQEPFVFVKSDNGTYGMGIMAVRSGEELYTLSRGTRKKMDVIKEGVRTGEVIIQEGVPTQDRIGNYSAEPMVYLAAGEVVSCCFRYNTERSEKDNLNSKGMKFFQEPENTPPCPALNLVARLASWASAWECYAENYDI